MGRTRCHGDMGVSAVYAEGSLANNNISPDRIASIGITNQRETLVMESQHRQTHL